MFPYVFRFNLKKHRSYKDLILVNQFRASKYLCGWPTAHITHSNCPQTHQSSISRARSRTRRGSHRISSVWYLLFHGEGNQIFNIIENFLKKIPGSRIKVETCDRFFLHFPALRWPTSARHVLVDWLQHSFRVHTPTPLDSPRGRQGNFITRQRGGEKGAKGQNGFDFFTRQRRQRGGEKGAKRWSTTKSTPEGGEMAHRGGEKAGEEIRQNTGLAYRRIEVSRKFR